MQHKQKVAIVGYGQFGRFMAKHLRTHVSVVPIRRTHDPKRIATCDIVIFTVPYEGLEETIKRLKPHIKKSALIIDVTSVKQKPIALLKKHFKGHGILGTHPIFGPQSGKNGIEGLPVVLCNVSFSKKNYASVKRFLRKELALKIIELSPKEHDREMARVQGLTHFIGRALLQLDVHTYPSNTKSYEQLLELKRLLRNDSWKLFETIQNANPEAKYIRKQFLNELKKIEQKLSD